MALDLMHSPWWLVAALVLLGLGAAAGWARYLARRQALRSDPGPQLQALRSSASTQLPHATADSAKAPGQTTLDQATVAAEAVHRAPGAHRPTAQQLAQQVCADPSPPAAIPAPAAQPPTVASRPTAQLGSPTPKLAAAPAPTPPPDQAGDAVAVAEAPAVDPALARGLARTQASLWGRLKEIFGAPNFDEATAEQLEEALLGADVGVGLTLRLIEQLRTEHDSGRLRGSDGLRQALHDSLAQALALPTAATATHTTTPAAGRSPGLRTILWVGVNGVGKTTSIGKMAARLQGQGQKVMLVAGDTFRAAAAEQLGTWAQRCGAAFFAGEPNADPAAVVYDGIVRARAQNCQVVLADTAGRLHTKTDLMDQIAKVRRAADKATAGGQVDIWLVVDGTTGQNALQQAREFDKALGLSGVVLTKLDGTAKGGVAVAIVDALKVPIHFIGVGEGIEDLRPFDAAQFVAALMPAA